MGDAAPLDASIAPKMELLPPKPEASFCEMHGVFVEPCAVHQVCTVPKTHELPVLQKFECEDCAQVFYQHSDLHQHKHNRRMSYAGRKPCVSVLQRQLNRLNQLKMRHRNTEEQELLFSLLGTRFKCLKCLRTFSKDWNAKQHFITKHSGFKHYQCEICSKKFSLQSYLKNHYKVCALGKEVEALEALNNLNSNGKNHSGSTPLFSKPGKRYKCLTCSLKIRKYTDAKRHFMIKHFRADPLTCEKCQCTFSQQDHLQSHLQKCLAKNVHRSSPIKKKPSYFNEEKLICDVCKLTFDDFSSLNRHKLVHSQLYSSHKCHMCDETFFNLEELSNHISTHTDSAQVEGLYSCTFCSYSTPNKQSSQRHLKTHYDPNKSKVRCEFCHLYFPDKKAMLLHQQANHNEPYDILKSTGPITQKLECIICKRYVTHRYLTLSQHLRLHSAEYACEVCNKHYQSFTSWRKHISKVHNDSMHVKMPCVTCGEEIPHGQMQLHITSTHWKVAQFFCYLCKSSQGSRKDAWKHVLQHYRSNMDVTKLPKPLVYGMPREPSHKAEASTERVIQSHQPILKPTKTKTYCCKACNKKFAQKIQLHFHYNRCAGNSKTVGNIGSYGESDQHTNFYECEFCDFSTYHRSARKKHVMRHHEATEFNIKCDWCEIYCSNMTTLANHHRKQHGQLVSIVNNEATKSIEEDAPESQKTASEDAQLYHCGHCDYSSVHKRNADAHREIHLKKTKMNHKCKHCKLYFTLKHITTHLRNEHSHLVPGEKTSGGASPLPGEKSSSAIHPLHTKNSLSKTQNRSMCKICKRFVMHKYTSLACHLRLHSEQYSCEICHLNFRTLTKWKDHGVQKHGSSDHEETPCPRCQENVPYGQMQFHITTTHAKPTKRHCYLCNVDHPDLSNAWTHLLSHYDSHSQTHMPKKIKGVKCLYCKRQFASSSQLQHHRCMLKPKNRFTCKSCGKKFTHNKLLHRHSTTCKVNIIDGAVSHVDEKAGEKADENRKDIQLSTELKKKTKGRYRCTKERVKCAICSNIIFQYVLAQHVRMHTHIKPLHCNLCGLQSSYKSSMRNHLRKLHTIVTDWESHMTLKDNTTFECRICGVSVNQESKLNEHFEEQHALTDEALRRPEHSSKLLKHDTKGTPHQGHHSNGNKQRSDVTPRPSPGNGGPAHTPWVCPKCTTPFSKKSRYKQHLHYCTGVKRKLLKCSYCTQVFTTYKGRSHHLASCDKKTK